MRLRGTSRGLVGWAVRLVLVAAAALAALVPPPPEIVERTYTEGVYPVVQRSLTGWSNRVPFAVFDVTLAIVSIGLLVIGWRHVSGPRREGGRVRWLAAIGDSLIFVATLYLLFLATWGLNYYRPPLDRLVQFDESVITPDALVEASTTAIRRLNGLAPRAHAAAWPALDALPRVLGPVFQRTLAASFSAPPTLGAPKPTLLGPYFRLAGVDGMTAPVTLEVLTNPRLLPVEQPFVLAHEWAHLAGFAREDEASYWAWVVCLHADAQAEYSAWLSVLGSLLNPLPQQHRTSLFESLDAVPRRDLAAIAARQREASPRIREAAWKTYDSYLKAHRVPQGVVSYDRVARYIVGVHRDEAGHPKRASPAVE